MGSAEEDTKIDAFIGVTNSNRMAGASYDQTKSNADRPVHPSHLTRALSPSRPAAIRYLQKADWDVDVAVAEFMSSADQAGAGQSVAGPSSSARPKAKQPVQRSGVATLGQYRGDDDDDSDEDNEYYAGGEKSGQVVKGADRGRDQRGHGGVEGVFDRARRAGADVVDHSELEGEPGGTSFRSFTGRGQTLSGISTQAGPAAGGSGQRQQLDDDDPNKPLKVTVAFYENGVFTVDDGEPRQIDAPENRAFMMAIMTGQCPDELLPEDPNQAIDVDMVRKTHDYEPPKYRAFKGAGHKLTSDEPKGEADAGAAAEAAATDAAAGSGSGSGSGWAGPDESKPTTSVQIRLADGSRLVAKFNLDQNVGDIRQFIRVCKPELGNGFSLATTFPTRALTDVGETIEAAGLAGAVVVQK